MSLLSSINSGCLLHRGGEAELYRVESGSGKKLTLKLYKDGLEYDARVIESLQKLSLPGIYHIVESGHVDGRAYVLYDFIDGVCSRDLSPLPLELALFYLRKLVVSLKELLQRGVSHGDICPDNVFFDRDASPVLIDFGICGPGMLMFSAPERIEGNSPTEKSDLFSLGALFYYWLTGEALFDGKDFEEILEKIANVDKVNPGMLLFEKASLGLKPETLSVLEPLWKGLLATNPESRLEGLDELDELLEIALDSLGGPGVHFACETDQLREKISGILTKNETKTPETVDFSFFKPSNGTKIPSRKYLWVTVLFIFLITVALVAFFAKGDEASSVDVIGEQLLQKSRSHEMESLTDSIKMPDLEGVLEKIAPEENK